MPCHAKKAWDPYNENSHFCPLALSVTKTPYLETPRKFKLPPGSSPVPNTSELDSEETWSDKEKADELDTNEEWMAVPWATTWDKWIQKRSEQHSWVQAASCIASMRITEHSLDGPINRAWWHTNRLLHMMHPLTLRGFPIIKVTAWNCKWPLSHSVQAMIVPAGLNVPVLLDYRGGQWYCSLSTKVLS